MSRVRSIFNTIGAIGVGGVAGWTVITRNSKFVPIDEADPIYTHPYVKEQNPYNNAFTHDYCVRRVPIKDIKPQLLEDDGKLVEAFAGAVWGSLGYAFQRAYLERKYKNDTTTAHQLWSRSALQQASYEPGTQVTDHFEVVYKEPTKIAFRCGDSPLIRGPRPNDGLFEMVTNVKKEEGVVEFGLKSVFFAGNQKTEGKPMPDPIEWLHRLYTKLLMETALPRLQR
ncbi:hypothetical protein B0O99DRAFT_688356 [Bisporella sp. PMI_857]|nr:hypothetical protein B0O99DRAFT_688356 [Bisporella sp. PMI_857]